MAGPLESAFGFFVQGDPLFELEAKLDDVLSHIAFDKFNAGYVERVTKELEGWKDFVDKNLDVPGLWHESPLLMTLDCLGNAYHGFMYPYYEGSWGDVSSEARQEDAEELLGENSFLGGDIGIPLACAVNALRNKYYEVKGWSIDSGGNIDLEYEKD